jgi:hypothetical protein
VLKGNHVLGFEDFYVKLVDSAKAVGGTHHTGLRWVSDGFADSFVIISNDGEIYRKRNATYGYMYFI